MLYKKILLYFIILNFISCGSHNYESVPLIDNLHSRMLVNDVKGTLSFYANNWVNDPNSGYYAVIINNYESLGFIGNLRIVFFEEYLKKILMATCFYHEEIEKYLVFLEKEKGYKFKKDYVSKRLSFDMNNLLISLNKEKNEMCWDDLSIDYYSD